MHPSAAHAALLVLVGAVLHVALEHGQSGLGRIAAPEPGASVPLWYALTSGPFSSLCAVVPGVAVGFSAQARGWLLGFLASFLGALGFAVLYSTNWPSLAGVGAGEHLVLLAQLAVLALGSGIIGLVAGAAGQLFRIGRAF